MKRKTENLINADAIEIKVGQGTKPGMGGCLPGSKVSEEISKFDFVEKVTNQTE